MLPVIKRPERWTTVAGHRPLSDGQDAPGRSPKEPLRPETGETPAFPYARRDSQQKRSRTKAASSGNAAVRSARQAM